MTHQGQGFWQGTSLLSGWLPITAQVVAGLLLLLAVARRSKRWWALWVPLSALVGALTAGCAWWYMRSEGLSGDPAPTRLWVWTGLAAFTLVVLVVGWRRGRWWQRIGSVLALPMAVLCAGLVLNQWVGYYRNVSDAWAGITQEPLPGAVSVSSLAALRNTDQPQGRWVSVDIPSTASGFKHRTEYVYLPPAWFRGAKAPSLPTVMMIGGEFNTPADWVRSGDIDQVVESYAKAHDGESPVLVLVDAGGTFNNDTECVDGPRGNVASHLTKDVPAYMEKTFGVSSAASHWGIVGWSMGGTCALDLVSMHPDLFTTFVSIGGDSQPNSGTASQTLARLYGGNVTAMANDTPSTVIARTHYQDVAGVFEVGSAQGSRWSQGEHQQEGTQPGGGPSAPAAAGAAPSSIPQPGGAPSTATGAHPSTAPSRSGQHTWNGQTGTWGGQNKSSTGTGLGGQDGGEMDDSYTLTSTSSLFSLARQHGMQVDVVATQDMHTWQFAQSAFTQCLPWLAARLGTPGSPSVAAPTATQ